jgi:hypothetical protein
LQRSGSPEFGPVEGITGTYDKNSGSGGERKAIYMVDEYLHALAIFASAFGVASFAGLATLLRFARKLSGILVASAMLNSGFLGLAIALIWYQNYLKAENVPGLLGICVLAGMGGSTVSDLLISVLTGAGISIKIMHDRDQNGDRPHE